MLYFWIERFLAYFVSKNKSYQLQKIVIIVYSRHFRCVQSSDFTTKQNNGAISAQRQFSIINCWEKLLQGNSIPTGHDIRKKSKLAVENRNRNSKSISSFHFEFWFRVSISISSSDFAVQLRVSISCFDFMFQFLVLISSFYFEFRFWGSTSSFDFEFRFGISISISSSNFEVRFRGLTFSY